MTGVEPSPDRPTLSEKLLLSVWGRIDEMRNDFNESPYFDEHRFDAGIHELRGELESALQDPRHRAERAEPQAFRNYHDMSMVRYALAATVYAPQLYLAQEDEQAHYLRQLAFQVQQGAAHTLDELFHDKYHHRTNGHMSYTRGFANEITPLSLLNRPRTVELTGKITLPASAEEDYHQKIDLKQLTVARKASTLNIQAKTRKAVDYQAPAGVIVIQASDFGNGQLSTSHLLTDEIRHPSSPQLNRLADNQALILSRRIARLASGVAIILRPAPYAEPQMKEQTEGQVS